MILVVTTNLYLKNLDMITNMESEGAGTLICSSKSTDVPSWGMYGAGLIATLLGILFFLASAPMLVGTRPGDFAGGAAGSAIGIILLVAGGAAIVAARRGSRSTQIHFHELGVRIGCGKQLSFFSYKDLETISIEIQQPSETTQASAIARGAFSLLVGNWAGVGYASGMMTSRGTVKFILPDHKECTSAECGIADLERLASVLEPLRNEKILSHVSV